MRSIKSSPILIASLIALSQHGLVTSFSLNQNGLSNSRYTTIGSGSPTLLRAEEESDESSNSSDSDSDSTAPLLEVKDLSVSINNNDILKKLNLKVNKGEVHAIMGTNGSGKSTLSKVLVGHPAYAVNGGDILFKGSSILELEPEERSHLGIFLAFQYPVEIPGVSNEDFLRLAYNSKQGYLGKEEVDPLTFLGLVNEKLKMVSMNPAFLARNVNEGFSGGEKKRNEILQMVLLDPDLSILDETDSGLDIDALKTISNGINAFMKEDKSVILITHYQRLLDYVVPNFVHVMQDGKIIKTGSADLAKELEAKGYEFLKS